jgi:hypothetical protein
MNRRRFLSNSVFSALFGTVASSIPAKGLAAFAKPAMLDVSPLTVGGFMYRGDSMEAPSSAITGDLFYNRDLCVMQMYDGSKWVTLTSGDLNSAAPMTHTSICGYCKTSVSSGSHCPSCGAPIA